MNKHEHFKNKLKMEKNITYIGEKNKHQENSNKQQAFKQKILTDYLKELMLLNTKIIQ